MIHNISKFIAALALLATAQGAWADTETVSYIDADGNEQTVTATVLTGNEEPSRWGSIELAAGWYVVKGNISYTNQISYASYPSGTIHIILADGAQMAVEYNGNAAILLDNDDPLAIYGQSAGTGRLSVTSDRNAICAYGGITINGGIVSATSTGYGNPAIFADDGAITINGGQVTATPGDNAMGISTLGTITLGLRSTSDFITANGYYGTVNIKDGQALKDPSGNIYYGTLTDAQKSAIANVTLQPATQAEFIAAALPQTAADTYTISDAAGWDAFCLALQDNDTWNRFSGKTVQLGADITVTRMAGSSGHDFCGTFDGDGHTLTLDYGSASEPFSENNAAPFRNVETGCVIENLHVAGDIYTSAKYAAGIAGTQYGAVTIRNCHVSTVIHSLTAGDGTHGGFVGSNGNGSGSSITIEGCLFDGKLLTEGTTATTDCSGFVGYKSNNRTVTITNSLYAPAAIDEGETEIATGATFVRNGSAGTNCYYTRALGTAQGKATRTVTAATDVTIDAVALTGTATQYTVSGITAYSGGGLQRGQTLYYGSGDQLSLTLSNTATGAPRGYQYGYTASAGTLSGTTLTMPDQDVTISVNTADLATIDWATVNQGDSDDPYMIYNKDQLLLLAHRVNGTSGETADEYEGKYFKLGADITFDHAAVEGDDYAENYEAIGGVFDGYSYYFCGDFDGDGHTVSGIRIRKDGTGINYGNVGLFGYLDEGSNVHDVHLTDARITGYENVGGIAGYTYKGIVTGCTVTDSYITASDDYGTICGGNDDGTLRNNYYHGCTVNGTAVTSGVGCGGSYFTDIADITANNGALPAYRLDLGANITTPPGTFVGQTGWLDTPPVNPRLAPENGFTLAGNHYFASGYEFTPGSTLASGAAQGYTPRATLDDVLLDLYTPTGDAPDYTGTAIARFTITADCDGKTLASTQAIYSTGQPVTVAYIKADGTAGEASAIALDGTETNLAAGWYFVGKDISYTQTLTLTGDVTLILKDGCAMNVGESDARVSGYGIDGYVNGDKTFTIYGQALGTGALNVYAIGTGFPIAICVDALTVNGGNIIADINGTEGATPIYSYGDININRGTVTTTATGTESYGIYAYNGTVNINGGTVTANGTENSIYGNAANINGGTITANGGGIYVDGENGNVTINGGNVTASSIYSDSGNITLGWTRPADRITASSISTGEGGTVAVADGQALTDGSGNIYTGTLTASELSGFAAETTLQPCLALADAADNSAAITDHAGQTLAVALSGRTLYKDGSWNTLCLPFDVTVSGSALDGDGVTIMTLNGETSSLDANGLLTLNFTDVTTGTLTAGTPYIIKWAKADGYDAASEDTRDISNPTFTGVTVKNDAPTAVSFSNALGDDCQFVGQYSPFSITDGNINEIVMLSANNTLGYSKNPRTLRSCRAHFLVPTTTSNAHAMARYAINFGDDESTGITTTNYTNYTNSDEWYTLDGRKLDGKPTAAGLYINNGKKIIIKIRKD